MFVLYSRDPFSVYYRAKTHVKYKEGMKIKVLLDCDIKYHDIMIIFLMQFISIFASLATFCPRCTFVFVQGASSINKILMALLGEKRTSRKPFYKVFSRFAYTVVIAGCNSKYHILLVTITVMTSLSLLFF